MSYDHMLAPVLAAVTRSPGMTAQKLAAALNAPRQGEVVKWKLRYLELQGDVRKRIGLGGHARWYPTLESEQVSNEPAGSR